MPGHSFTLQELYDLVWSEPMIKLGARYGISGNGLAKACRKAGIPVPERGYWAKLQAGRTVPKPPLISKKAAATTRITISPPLPRKLKSEPPSLPASVQEKIDSVCKSSKTITVATTLSSPHYIIASWLNEARRSRTRGRLDAWFPTSKEVDATDLDKRRLRILSSLLKALEHNGYKLTAGASHINPIKVMLDEASLDVLLEERIKQVRRQLTDGDRKRGLFLSHGQKWTQERIPTGELVLKISDQRRHGLSKEWRESAEDPMEGKLHSILGQAAGMFEELRLRRQREAEEQEHRWKAEEERRRKEMERKRETIRFHRLLNHCESWDTAARIRGLVASIENSDQSKDVERFVAWKTWALRHAERIDPLRDADLFNLKVDDYEVYAYRE